MTFAPKYALTYNVSIPQRHKHVLSQHNRLYSTCSNSSAAIDLAHVQRLAHRPWAAHHQAKQQTAGPTKVAVKRDRWPKRLAH